MSFRIDPTSINLNYSIHTSVQETVGGRVTQILGATLGDISILGTVGEDRTRGPGKNGAPHPGNGYALIKEFYGKIRDMIVFQSANVDKPALAIPTATFAYPPLNIRLPVYVKSLSDPDADGQSAVYNQTGKYLYRYALTLFPVQQSGQTLVQAGQSGATFDQAKAQAIEGYLNRITGSNGLGWRPTIYNGGLGNGLQLVQVAPTTAGGAGGSGNAGSSSGVSSASAISVSQVTYGKYSGGGDLVGWITAAAGAIGVAAGDVANWVKGYQTIAERESSGDPNAVNTTDSNAVGATAPDGHPAQCSRGVVQCIPQTFASNHAANTSTDIYDPVANIASSMNYVIGTYGVSKSGSDLASKVQQADPNRPPKGY